MVGLEMRQYLLNAQMNHLVVFLLISSLISLYSKTYLVFQCFEIPYHFTRLYKSYVLLKRCAF